jgi:hypothetical protein
MELLDMQLPCSGINVQCRNYLQMADLGIHQLHRIDLIRSTEGWANFSEYAVVSEWEARRHVSKSADDTVQTEIVFLSCGYTRT